MLSTPHISPQQLEELFPFYIVVDAALTILQVGPSLQKLLPPPFPSLHQEFEVKRPDVPLTFASLSSDRHLLWVLRSRTNEEFMLRGQWLPLQNETSNPWIFLGSPWLTHPKQISALGLKLKDFALHDPAIDLLHLLQMTEQSLHDAHEIAEEEGVVLVPGVLCKETAEEFIDSF